MSRNNQDALPADMEPPVKISPIGGGRPPRATPRPTQRTRDALDLVNAEMRLRHHTKKVVAPRRFSIRNIPSVFPSPYDPVGYRKAFPDTCVQLLQSNFDSPKQIAELLSVDVSTAHRWWNGDGAPEGWVIGYLIDCAAREQTSFSALMHLVISALTRRLHQVVQVALDEASDEPGVTIPRNRRETLTARIVHRVMSLVRQ